MEWGGWLKGSMKEVGEFELRFLFLKSVFRLPLPSLGPLFHFAVPFLSLVTVCLELVTPSDA